MVLNTLTTYYEQLLADHPGDIAPFGWSSCKVSLCLEVTPEGKLANIVSLGDCGRTMLVPAQAKKSSGIAPNFLCDSGKYLLGLDDSAFKHDQGSSEEPNRKAQRAIRCFEASRDLHHSVLDDVDSQTAHAVLSFFDTWDPESALEDYIVRAHADMLEKGGFVTFVVVADGSSTYAFGDSNIVHAWESTYAARLDDTDRMRCLVSGDVLPVARLHPSIKGVAGAQSSGASLVSFNDRADESYGHAEEQGRNAPVSVEAAHAYGMALNYLLSEACHHAQLGDTTIVYWSERKDEQNSSLMSDIAFGSFLAGGTSVEQEAQQKRIDAEIKSLVKGNYHDISGADFESPFFILGLAPNASRLAIRFFLRDSFGAFVEHLARHYRRIAISHSKTQREYLAPYALLHEVENPNSKRPVFISPLCAPFLRSILSDTSYPESLFSSVITRIRSTQDDEDKHTRKVDRGRAALIKAYLIKNKGLSEKEITVSLNEARESIPYCLGRTFCLLEDIQRKANDGNTNISSRYMDSASATPSVVFPTLLRLANAHIEKVSHDSPGLAVGFKKELAQLLSKPDMEEFPSRLSLAEQGDFFLGYYHQLARNIQSAQERAAQKSAAGKEE